MKKMAQISTIMCVLCSSGAALAAKDCQINADDNMAKGLRHIEVIGNQRGARQPGDVVFMFKDRSPVIINAIDPEPQPVAGMPGAQMKDLLFRQHLYKSAKIHHRLCQAGVNK